MEKNLQENSSDMYENIFKQFDSIFEDLTSLKGYFSNLQNKVKTLEKNVKKEYKKLSKEVEKNKNKGNRKPSGFAKPTIVSKELCEFLNKSEGSEIARTDVTKALIEYITKNNLQNNTNKQIIVPDDKLKILLGIKDNEPSLSYFTLQKYMNKHFIKKNIDLNSEI
jgi:chromatin remodeling complex protein RSC6